MKAWRLYCFLCWSLVVFNFLLSLVGIWFALKADELSDGQVFDGSLVRTVGFLAVGMGVVFGALNATLVFLPKNPYTYGLHFTNIVLTAMTCVLAPISIPLWILWHKPETRNLFHLS